MSVDAKLLEIIVCPACHGDLALRPAERGDGEELACTGECGRIYPVRDDIPVLLVDEARLPA